MKNLYKNVLKSNKLTFTSGTHTYTQPQKNNIATPSQFKRNKLLHFRFEKIPP